MKPAVLTSLGLDGHVDNVVGTALLARAAAMDERRTGGASARMEDLAALSIGAMAVLSADVTRRAASGLAMTLAQTASTLGAIAGGIAVAIGDPPPNRGLFLTDPQTVGAAPFGWLVFSILQAVLAVPDPLTDDLRWRDARLEELFAVVGRDDGQPVGRLGISAYRWMRLASFPSGPERSYAARWILERGAEDVERAMQDVYHWQRLHAGLAPVEPELLLAALVFLRGEPLSPFGPDSRAASRPVVTAALATAACMLGQDDLARELGGPETVIEGRAGGRWQRWLDHLSEGPLTW